MAIPLLLAAVIAQAQAQAAAPPVAPRAGGRAVPVLSPEVMPDGRVTFRLRAPQAKLVEVAGQFARDKVKLSRDENGDLWLATVGPVPAGIYEYGFVVDGLRMIDPANASIKPQRWPSSSILEVPADPPLVTQFQDVPHGTIRVHHYRSKALGGKLRRLHVYTPADYDAGRGKYPVLFLGHGHSDNDATWTTHGRANHVLDNLIAQKKARPMVVVMMDGHPLPPERRGKTDGKPEPFDDNTEAYRRELLEDVLPWASKSYRVRTDSEGRAIVGLSMGGQQSLTVGLNHADLFGWVGSFSGAVPKEAQLASALADPKALGKRLRWLWIGCGKDDFLLVRNQEFVKLLDGKGVAHTWRLTEGGHSWPIWREYLAEILPQLFAPAARRRT